MPWLTVAPHESDEVLEFSVVSRAAMPEPQGRALGVQVYTPFFRPVAFRWQPRGVVSCARLRDVISDHVGGVPHELYSLIVPVLPQRFEGYGIFVRIPSHTRCANGANLAAVIFDLTRVGGNYFADYVPKEIPYEDLEARVRPFTSDHDGCLLFFVGRRSEPWPRGQPFVLQDGVSIAVTRTADAWIYRGTSDDLFVEDAFWGPVQHMPLPHPAHGTYVLYDQEEFFFAPYHQEGKGLAEAVASRVKKHLDELTSCSFPSENLDFKGHSCDLVFFAVNLPWPQPGSVHLQRRDYFTFCDTRALGVMPRVVHTHHPVLHIPSVASVLGIQLPPMLRLAAVGGRTVAEEVFVGGHSSLVFYALRGGTSDSEDAEQNPDDVRHLASDQEDGRNHVGRRSWDDAVPEEETLGRNLRAITRSPSLQPSRFPDESSSDSIDSGGSSQVLGLVLFAPQYQPESIALRVPAEADVISTLRRLRSISQDLPLSALDCISTVEPTPFPGFATAIAYSCVLDANENVAVVARWKQVCNSSSHHACLRGLGAF